MHHLFVYGTLRHRPLLDALVGRPVEARPARLPCHRAAVLHDRDYPGLVADPEADAVGSLIVVDDDGLAVLDRFEGTEYTRTPVTVATDDGPVPAETYLFTGPSRALVAGATWSFDDFVAEAADGWVRGTRS